MTFASGAVGALAAASDAIGAAGSDSPRLDAELLLAKASGLTPAQMAADAPLDPGAARHFAELVRRRLRREPIAYIVGSQGFRRIELAVDPRVLIPRPETELLVDLALERKATSVLDVGTGSGAIALAVAHELPGASVIATDLYPEALDVACGNARRLGLADRVSFEAGTLPAAGGRFDLLLANLPYVTALEWMELTPDVRDFEPRGSLVPGVTGLEAIETLLAELSVSSRVAATAIGLEVGEGQAGAVSELVRRAGWERVEIRPDLAGIERVVVGAPA